MIRFTVYGKPLAKKRPRFARCGNFVKTYTPQDTLNYENLIKTEFTKIRPKDFQVLQGTVFLSLLCFFPIPKATSKKIRKIIDETGMYHIKKPDADNVLKIVKDSLNNIAWKDDSQIASISMQKKYSDTPRVEISFREI